jgi:hypothetical protein
MQTASDHTSSTSILCDTAYSGTHIIGWLAETYNSSLAISSEYKHGERCDARQGVGCGPYRILMNTCIQNIQEYYSQFAPMIHIGCV